ncbi:MAG: lamin tail domain-containing protein [Haloplanus sp.]
MLSLASLAFGLALSLAGGAYAVFRAGLDYRTALVGATVLLAVGGAAAQVAPGADSTDLDGDASASAAVDADRAAARVAPSNATGESTVGATTNGSTAADATGATNRSRAGTNATIVGVVAGDWITYRTASGTRRTVRLAGIDAPGVGGDDPTQFDGVLTGTRGRACLGTQGRRAVRFLRTLRNETVRVRRVASERGVRAAILAVDGRSLNRRLVERGYARATADRYADAETAARSARLGVWSCTVVRPDRPLRESNESAIRVAAVHPNPPGDDAASLADEYVVIENTGRRSVDLSDWYLVDGDGRTYFSFDGRTLRPGEELVFHVGEGRDTDGHVYWGESTPVLDNDHETLTLVDGDADRVVRSSY